MLCQALDLWSGWDTLPVLAKRKHKSLWLYMRLQKAPTAQCRVLRHFRDFFMLPVGLGKNSPSACQSSWAGEMNQMQVMKTEEMSLPGRKQSGCARWIWVKESRLVWWQPQIPREKGYKADPEIQELMHEPWALRGFVKHMKEFELESRQYKIVDLKWLDLSAG